MDEDHVMLDPIKVTILTPGIGTDGKMTPFGIPASIVSRFLISEGVVVEKTGFYSFLILFSLGNWPFPRNDDFQRNYQREVWHFNILFV